MDPGDRRVLPARGAVLATQLSGEGGGLHDVIVIAAVVLLGHGERTLVLQVQLCLLVVVSLQLRVVVPQVRRG
jgi:hypothetical protein